MLTWAEAKEKFEREYFHEVFTLARGNITEAARIMDSMRTEIYSRIKKYNIDVKSYKNPQPVEPEKVEMPYPLPFIEEPAEVVPPLLPYRDVPLASERAVYAKFAKYAEFADYSEFAEFANFANQERPPSKFVQFAKAALPSD